MRENAVEYLDELPNGYVLSVAGNVLESLGIASVKRKWRLPSGLQGTDVYVPEWARRVMNAFVEADAAHQRAFQDIRNDVLKKLAALDDEARNAAMTVFDLGGKEALVQHVLGEPDFLFLVNELP